MKSRIIKNKYERIIIKFPEETTQTEYRRFANVLRSKEAHRAIILPITWEVEWLPRFRLKDLVKYIVQAIRGWLYRK